MSRPRVSLKTRSMGDEIAYLIDKALGQTNVPEIVALRLRLETAFEIRIRDSRARVAELEAALIEAEGALKRGSDCLGGWREAVVELEDWCLSGVALKNMVAAADQMDEWKPMARNALARLQALRGGESEDVG